MRARHRPVDNKWIGQRLVDPNVDIAMLARAQGAVGIGPITAHGELLPAMENALDQVRQGRVCVVDVHVAPGYE